MFDLIILGGSAAGVSAAVYAARRRLNLKLITPDFGGEIATTQEIENYPGFVKITGQELVQKFREQLTANQVPIAEGFLAQKVEKSGEFFKVTAQNLAGQTQIFEAKAIIIATGVKPRLLGVSGEEKLFHRGVTYCAVCDAPLFKNKTVVVIGGGNSALGSALMLGEIAAKIYLLNAEPSFKGETILIEKVKNHPKIEILSSAAVEEILGDKIVTGLKYKDKNGESKTLEVKGVFIHIGWDPNADFIDFVKKNEKGEIMADRAGLTNVPGLFAAGDVTDGPYKQIIIAVGMCASAALSVVEYLNKS